MKKITIIIAMVVFVGCELNSPKPPPNIVPNDLDGPGPNPDPTPGPKPPPGPDPFAPGKVIEPKNNEEFKSMTRRLPGQILVYVGAEWCGACRNAWPIVQDFAKSYPGVAVFKIDDDKIPQVADQYKITALPAFLSWQREGEHNMLYGVQSKEALYDFVQRVGVRRIE